MSRAAAAWIASPQLKNAKHTTKSARSWRKALETLELIRKGTPPATVLASPFDPAGMVRMSAATSTKLVMPAVSSEEMMARGTRFEACTTSSATSPADSKP